MADKENHDYVRSNANDPRQKPGLSKSPRDVNSEKSEYNNEKTTNDRLSQQKMANWTRNVGVFTGLLVIVSGISDWFIYRQWDISNQQMISGHEQLRAFVIGPSFIAVVSPTSDDPRIYVAVQFQNIGATRTSHFAAWSSIKYFPDGIPNALDISKPYEAIDLKDRVIAPNSIVTATVAIDKDDVTKAKTKGVILIWGYGEYSDIFDPHVIHKIKYCQTVIQVAGGKPDQLSLTGQDYRSECNSNE